MVSMLVIVSSFVVPWSLGGRKPQPDDPVAAMSPFMKPSV